MDRACHIAVIADDVTGAADTGVQFCPAVGPVLMTGIGEGEMNTGVIPAAGVAVFTLSRHMAAGQAAVTVHRAAEKIRRLHPRMLYKKIDSCLRGNLGAEIEALLSATDAAASFIAPAFPSQGRTTTGDCHRIHGVPVAETEIGHDPLGPVHESRLSVLLSAQCRMPVGHVDLACIEKGRGELTMRVRTLLAQGCRHIAFDTVRNEHLDAIAGLILGPFPQVLPVGSAGLAHSLSRHLARGHPFPTRVRRPRIEKWLFVCGSASQMLAEQVQALVRATGWHHLPVDPSALTAGAGAAFSDIQHAGMVNVGESGGLILSLKPIPDSGPTTNPDQVVRGLAHLAAARLDISAAQGVFLCGGDTAEAFRQRIGASALIILEEILPGLMRGEFVGGPLAGLTVVTKAGAFGNRDTLNRLIDTLK